MLYKSVILFSHLVDLVHSSFKRNRKMGDSIKYLLKAVEIGSVEKNEVANCFKKKEGENLYNFKMM